MEADPFSFPAGGSRYQDDAKPDFLEERGWPLCQPRPQSELEWLVLAQHYGIPTPLLDWTTNPLTAFFFAAQRSEQQANGAVIAFKRSEFDHFNHLETVNPFRVDRDRPGIFEASGLNIRSIAQDSIMTIHTERLSFIDRPEASFFEIGHVAKLQVQPVLKAIGFSVERMFVDITVAAREFAETLEIEALF